MQMQKAIHQILEGNFDYENGSLGFSCEKIELSVRPGRRYEGSFRIYGPAGRFTGGTVVSSDWRMECLTSDFTGTDEEILFCFHGEALEEGDVVKGIFEIISNQGEYYLPYVASVERLVLESSVGEIRNLFHFANLAKANWEEAVKLFYSPEFARVFSGSEDEYAEDYRALSAYKGQEQNMEEFLVRINKKQRMEFLAEQEALFWRVEAYDAADVIEQEIDILRNGWGFTQLFVECRGDFLFAEKETLTDDDFLGNRCRLPVFIETGLCHGGRNYGQLRLFNAHVSLVVPVTVQVGRERAGDSPETERKRIMAQIMGRYLDFRMRKISMPIWIRETEGLVERLAAMDENDMAARLFQAQLLITEERYHEAEWTLNYVAELFGRFCPADEQRAYYLYLTTLVHREAGYLARAAAEVERIYRRDDSNWRVAWLFLYLSEECQKQDKNKWALLERLFEAGCGSPVLYVEAVSVLNANPALLRRLGRLEQRLLFYGTRHGLLRREVAEQAIYLAGRTKEYSGLLVAALERMYGKKKDVRLLQEICALLIKGGRKGPKYFEWYRLGVEAQLKVTNLYEYYMMSLDLETSQELPKSVLMYFSYQNNLDYAHSAYLYDYVVRNRDRPGEIYETYRPRMEQFIVEQICRGHIDRHLAALYSQLLRPDMVDAQTSGPLARLLFANLVKVADGRFRKIYVYQPGNLRPCEYNLTEGRTWVALYGAKYTIVFEDGWKNRFVANLDYEIEKLMIPGKLLRWILPYAEADLGLDMYMCDSGGAYKEEMPGRVGRELRVAASDDTAGPVRRAMILRVLQHYYDTDDMRSLDMYLKNLPMQEFTARERGTIVGYMVARGQYDLAGQWMRIYGPYFVDAKMLVRLVGALLEKNNMAEDALLTAAAVYSFRKGKYDSRILEYLIMYYQGMTRNMRDIWKAARSFDLDCYRISERILVRMLYSGAFVGEKMEIFRYYVSQGARPEVEEAFLAQSAYDFFVRERVMEEEVFREIAHMYLRGEPLQKICKLAVLKYFAENCGAADGEQGELCHSFLLDMLEDGIYLEFFKAFQDCRPMQEEMADKTVIEYHADPRCRAVIHYSVLYESGEASEYRAEYMKEAYHGVFFQDFVLFFGESLQYYITEERDGEEQLTESGTLQISGLGSEEESRYRLINDIAISKSLEDFDTMDSLLDEYGRRDFLNSRLFSLQ